MRLNDTKIGPVKIGIPIPLTFRKRWTGRGVWGGKTDERGERASSNSARDQCQLSTTDSDFDLVVFFSCPNSNSESLWFLPLTYSTSARSKKIGSRYIYAIYCCHRS